MALESSFNYISDLSASNPAAGDNPNDGDNHIRGIKNVLKTTFTGGSTGLSGAVTVTHTEMNYLAGVTSALQTQLNQLKPTWTTVSTTPYTAADGGWYLVRTNAAAIEIDLPAGVTGAIIRVKDADANAGTYNISIDPNGTETIEDIAAGDKLVLSTDCAFVTLQYLNGSWRVR